METKLMIEHLEEKLSRWLLLEYRHASEWWSRNVIFTNVRNKEEAEKLSNLGRVIPKRFYEIVQPDEEVIILDPAAEVELKTCDFKNASYVVVGGICGDEVMRGRTGKFITSPALKRRGKFRIRNLGKVQLPIDQAAIVAKLIMRGKKLDEIEILPKLRLTLEECEGMKRIVELPYGYVSIKGKPVITADFMKILNEGWELSCEVLSSDPHEQQAAYSQKTHKSEDVGERGEQNGR